MQLDGSSIGGGVDTGQPERESFSYKVLHRDTCLSPAESRVSRGCDCRL